MKVLSFKFFKVFLFEGRLSPPLKRGKGGVGMREGPAVLQCSVHNERLHHKVRCWVLLATRWIQETLLCRYFVTCYSVTPPE